MRSHVCDSACSALGALHLADDDLLIWELQREEAFGGGGGAGPALPELRAHLSLSCCPAEPGWLVDRNGSVWGGIEVGRSFWGGG